MTSKEFKALKEELIHKARLVVIQRKPNTCVIVEVKHNGQQYVDFGFSKVNWPDWFLPRRGKEIAAGRAIANIAERVKYGREELSSETQLYSECGGNVPMDAPMTELQGWIHFTQNPQNSTIGS